MFKSANISSKLLVVLEYLISGDNHLIPILILKQTPQGYRYECYFPEMEPLIGICASLFK